MSNTIYIIGHKCPDLDSIAAAAAYAYLKNKIDPENKYIAVCAGEANMETKYAFEKFGIELPEILDNASGKKIILVDHNAKEEFAGNMEEVEIIEIIDHHKMKFEYGSPIFIHIEPIGSTCTILAKMFEINNVEIPKDLAGIMLSAALIDTVITKSPTCAQDDVEIIKKLSEVVGADYTEFGIELFKVRSNVRSLPAMEILRSDQKDFDINGKKFSISQVETVDLSEFENLTEKLFEAIKSKKEQGSYHSVILFITDILNKGSRFLVISDEPEKFEKTFGCKLENNECYIDGIMSRKKQVVPQLLENF
ncbi:MAG: manganese-dependent inorganic pyrophosphatase [bacterium]